MANGDTNLPKLQNCRRKLQDKFEQSGESSGSGSTSTRSVLSSISLDETRKVLRNGSERVSRAFSSFRTTFGSFSQVGVGWFCFGVFCLDEVVLEV